MFSLQVAEWLASRVIRLMTNHCLPSQALSWWDNERPWERGDVSLTRTYLPFHWELDGGGGLVLGAPGKITGNFACFKSFPHRPASLRMCVAYLPIFSKKPDNETFIHEVEITLSYLTVAASTSFVRHIRVSLCII